VKFTSCHTDCYGSYSSNLFSWDIWLISWWGYGLSGTFSVAFLSLSRLKKVCWYLNWATTTSFHMLTCSLINSFLSASMLYTSMNVVQIWIFTKENSCMISFLSFWLLYKYRSMRVVQGWPEFLQNTYACQNHQTITPILDIVVLHFSFTMARC
jgi:hypothetical protein